MKPTSVPGCVRLPRSGEFNSVAEDDERRLFMTGSMCLDRFMVETDLLSASTKTHTKTKSTQRHTAAWDTKQKGQKSCTESSVLKHWPGRTDRINRVQRECGLKGGGHGAVTFSTLLFYSMFQWCSRGHTRIYTISPPGCLYIPTTTHELFTYP